MLVWSGAKWFLHKEDHSHSIYSQSMREVDCMSSLPKVAQILGCKFWCLNILSLQSSYLLVCYLQEKCTISEDLANIGFIIVKHSFSVIMDFISNKIFCCCWYLFVLSRFKRPSFHGPGNRHSSGTDPDGNMDY
jgi:hypothetical protein